MNMTIQHLIAPTKRSNIVFLENAFVELSDGSLIYKKSGDGDFNDYNIPYANTSMLLLGKSVQITQDGMRRLSDSGVMVCLCGFDAEFARPGQSLFQMLEPQLSRPNTEYMKKWSAIFLDEKRSSAAARRIIKEMIGFTKKMWEDLPETVEYGVYPEEISGEISTLMRKINDANKPASELHKEMLIYENAILARVAPLYGFYGDRKNGFGSDISSRYLDIANYFSYGYAAITLNALGIPLSFSVICSSAGMNGLVIDLSSIIRDAICLPVALEAAMSGRDEDEMITSLKLAMHEHGILDHLFKTFKNICNLC